MAGERKVRQRGKKKSKQHHPRPLASGEQQHEQQPDWVLSEQEYDKQQQDRDDARQGHGGKQGTSTPFGLVAPEIKSYFRTAHADLLAAEAGPDHGQEQAGDGDYSGGEQHSLFLNAALQELSGHELALATDPDTSVVLEYIITHVNRLQRRILTDRLSGNLFVLATHRFGSHVMESLLHALGEDVYSPHASQSMHGTPPTASGSSAASERDLGTLRSAAQLLVDFASELKQYHPDALMELLHHQFGSHTLRSLLSALSGRSPSGTGLQLDIRSKRSAAFRQKEGLQAQDNKGKTRADGLASRATMPTELRQSLNDLIGDLSASLDKEKVRALAHNQIAAPTLGVLLDLEPCLMGETSSFGPLLDQLLESIPSTCLDHYRRQLRQKPAGVGRPASPPTMLERSDFMESAIRDTTASHLIQRALEKLAELAQAALPGSEAELVTQMSGHLFWRTYLQGRMIHFALHPTGNYVVQACIQLLGGDGTGAITTPADDHDALKLAIAELHSGGGELVKVSMAPVPVLSSSDANGHKSKGRNQALLRANHATRSENRTGVLYAMLLRAARLGSSAGYVAASVQAILVSFGLGGDTETVDDDRGPAQTTAANISGHGAEQRIALIVPCLLLMRTWESYLQLHKQVAALKAKDGNDSSIDIAICLEHEPISLHGSLILQALFRLDASDNQLAYDSLLHPLNGSTLLRAMGRSSTGVHALLTALGSATASYKHRVALFRALVPLLVDMTISGSEAKWGSRVADACWDRADPFMKEKIANEALHRERVLLSSSYGNYFLRRINLSAFRRDPHKWKTQYAQGLERLPLTPGLADEWKTERSRLATQVDNARSSTAQSNAANNIEQLSESTRPLDEDATRIKERRTEKGRKPPKGQPAFGQCDPAKGSKKVKRESAIAGRGSELADILAELPESDMGSNSRRPAKKAKRGRSD